MYINETTRVHKNSLLFTSLTVAVAAISIGLFVSLFPVHRQYFPMGISEKDGDKDAGALGEEQFFFNARKNIHTNAMDYPAMLAASIADRAMSKTHNTHSATSAAVPDFSWMSMGPTNIGGRTRAILIDNNDPTHQTIFAGGVSGGIWKSTNGGGTWGNTTAAIAYSQNDTLANLNVCSIAQDANGAIYIGTGEGITYFGSGSADFSQGELGGGIFKSTDDGNTWRLLPKTVPSTANNNGIAWAYVNRLAIRPDNFKEIYAATSFGVYVSRDSGATWRSAYSTPSASGKLTGAGYNSMDLEISADGSIIVASIGGTGYYCYPKNNDSIFTKMKTTGAGHLPYSGDRIEFAISPTDPNRIYASYVDASRTFAGSAGASSGIFMNTTAVSSGNGGYWYEIGPGGGGFDPYAEPSSPITLDQSWYDNTLGVPPANEAQVLCGGTTLWVWSGVNLADTVGEWIQTSSYSAVIHPDMHAIVFDRKNPETVYIGCDGGVYKSTNMYISPNSDTAKSVKHFRGAISSLSIYPINRNYNVTQYYSLCFAPYDSAYSVPVSINNGTGTEQQTQYLGVGGGTQDNGSPYVNGAVAGGYPNDGKDLSGGDGAGSVVSTLNPNIAYFCSDYGTLLHEGNLPALTFPTSAYTSSIGPDGGDIDSAAALGGACFVFPVALYENSYDTLNHDVILFIADTAFAKGDTIWPTSATAGITYPYILPKALSKGDSLNVPDRVVSRLAVGFAGSYGGLWINGQAAGPGTVIWIPIGGPYSTPTAFSGSSPIHAIAWAADGNTIFAGTEDGHVYRFTNINSIIANNYRSGALWYNENGIHATGNTNISCTLLNISAFSGRDILSISTDPNNVNNVLITAGNYGETTYMEYSTNATAATPTFTSVQGDLPDMPVYSTILDILDSNNNYITGSAMAATEHGIYTTTNIAAASVKWVKNNNGMANVLTFAIKQQTAKPWLCNNAGVIYAATHGRGLWSSNDFYNRPTAVANINSPKAANDLLIYPNPMSAMGNINYSLASADMVTIAIYDMQGREVKTINLGNQSQGSHIVSFESTGLREGTYFAALTGSNFRKVSKFVVVR